MIRLTEEQLREKAAFVYNYIGNSGNNASNSEVDPNANVTIKTVATMDSEVNKAEDVQINRYILGEKIRKMFGDAEHDQYYSMLENHQIYSHDESAILKPYCVAIDLSPFLKDGNIPIGGNSKAPHNIRSFCGIYVNLMFLIAGQFAGAVADVSLLLWFHYFAKKEYGADYLVTHKKEIDGFLSQIVYTLNDPSIGRGGQSIFYNTSIFDKGYFEALFTHLTYPDGTVPVYEEVDRLQRYFMHWFNEERTKALLTFPVITAAYLTENGIPKYPEFVDFLASEMAEGNSFFHYHSDNPDSLSSCCRLRNKVDVNQFTYTLGGTGVMTGSKKVFTLNVNRMAQDGRDLITELTHIHKYLTAYNEELWSLQERHMLTAYDAGYIHLDKQYLTVGVNGVLEAAEYLGYDTSCYNKKYEDWLIKLFRIISSLNKQDSENYTISTGHKVMFNCEIVPAENVGVKFARWDKKDEYKVPRDCYNSYLYEVENPDTTILDKLRIQGKELTDSIDGGAAVHLNLKECPNKGTWLKIIQMAITAGCSYWTYNVRETCCEDCGYISKEDRTSCPVCGSKNVTWATRIIGYLKKVKSFSKERQDEEKRRFKS